MIVCLFMFLSTQTHGQQHLLLYIPSLIMLTLISIRHITKRMGFGRNIAFGVGTFGECIYSTHTTA